MVLYPGGIGPGTDNTGLIRTPTFYIDDSEVEIADRRHILLSAVTFQDDGLAISAVLRCKQELMLPDDDEIKWNMKGMTREQIYALRNAMLPVLSHARATLIIHTGTRAEAAIELARQLSDYCRELNAPGFVCRFDRGIVEGATFTHGVRQLKLPCVGFSSSDSRFDPLIQCADLFCGFQKLRIDIGTGRVDGAKMIQADVYEEEAGECPLSWYLSAGLRYCLWGHRTGDRDSPTKVNRDLGVRVFSTASEEHLNKALQQISAEYMGCIH